MKKRIFIFMLLFLVSNLFARKWTCFDVKHHTESALFGFYAEKKYLPKDFSELENFALKKENLKSFFELQKEMNFNIEYKKISENFSWTFIEDKNLEDSNENICDIFEKSIAFLFVADKNQIIVFKDGKPDYRYERNSKGEIKNKVSIKNSKIYER